MRIWLALLVSPSLALACQSVMFALVTPSCSQQTLAGIHAVAFGSLLLSALFTLLAMGEWRAGAPVPFGLDSDCADKPTQHRFLAGVATAVGAISTLVIVTMWIAAWVLSPCWS